MCIAFPGRVVAIDRTGAVIETEGRLRRASTLVVTDLAIGDWVTVAAGTVLARLDASEAEEVRAMLLAASVAPDSPTQPNHASLAAHEGIE
jgi:hydrogenase assembly chaperone HypC/HupF